MQRGPAGSTRKPRDLRQRIVLAGRRRGVFTDVYAFLLGASWRRLVATFAVVYLALNTLFAVLYLAGGDAIHGAHPGSFWDAFFFSVQTLSTIGYGVLNPQGGFGNGLVVVEAFIEIMMIALATGLVFAKFSRPSARVVFSEVAVVGPRDGRPCLCFRVGNARGVELVEASVRVSVLLDEVTQEGESIRRFYDMELERRSTPVFMMSWLVIHPIDEASPLFGLSAEELVRRGAHIAVTLTGIDATFSQTVHARHDFNPEHIVWGARFVDVIEALPDGRVRLDFGKFHDVVSIEASAGLGVAVVAGAEDA